MSLSASGIVMNVLSNTSQPTVLQKVQSKAPKKDKDKKKEKVRPTFLWN